MVLRWRLVVMPVVCLFIFLPQGRADIVEKISLVEGAIQAIPEVPLDHGFVADPEIVTITVTHDGIGTLEGRQPGNTWLFYWYQGKSYRKEIEVTEDPFKIFQQERDTAYLKWRRFNILNGYQFRFSTSFSEIEPPTDFRFLHFLTFGYDFGRYYHMRGQVAFDHKRGTANVSLPRLIDLTNFHFTTQYADVSVGDVSGGRATGLPIANPMQFRGMGVTLHNFMKDPEDQIEAQLEFFGGWAPDEDHRVFPNIRTAPASFGAGWSQVNKSTDRTLGVQTALFQTKGGSPYRLSFAQSASGKEGKVGWRESLLWSGSGPGATVNNSYDLKKVRLGWNYAFAGHDLISFQGIRQGNDRHSYGIGLSEEVLPKRLIFYQGFSHGMTVSRPASPVFSRSLGGRSGFDWKPQEENSFGMNYAIVDTITDKPGLIDDQDSTEHQASLFHFHRFALQESLVSTVTYQRGTGTIANHNLGVTTNYSIQGPSSGWNVGGQIFEDLHMAGRRSGNVSLQSDRPWGPLFLRFGSSVSAHQDPNRPTRLDWGHDFGVTWSPRPPYQLVATLNSRFKVHPWDRPPHWGGDFFVTFTTDLSHLPRIFVRNPKRHKVTKATITGRVFLDQNGNGRMDSGEKGLSHVRVSLDGNSTVETNKGGRYFFERLVPGSYLLQVVPEDLPEGMVASASSSPMVEIAPIGSKHYRLDYAVSEKTVRLFVSLVEDQNKNSRVDFDDIGIAGVTVILSWQGQEGIACETTPKGSCIFQSLPKAPMTLKVTPDSLPEGVTLVRTEEPIEITESKDYHVPFFVQIERVLKGRVFLDRDKNFKFYEGHDQPLAHAVLRVGDQKAVADSQGFFLIRHLKFGNYEVRLLKGVVKGFEMTPLSRQVTIGEGGGITEKNIILQR